MAAVRSSSSNPHASPRSGIRPSDLVALGVLEAALSMARDSGEDRPPLEIIAGSLAESGVQPACGRRSARLLARDRDGWLLRLRSADRSASAINAYRHAIDDLLAWAERCDRVGELFEERAIVDYFADYRERCTPAPATYHRRFLLLRRFMRWVSQRNGLPDPFLELKRPRSHARRATGSPARSSHGCWRRRRVLSETTPAWPSGTTRAAGARDDRASPLRADRAGLARCDARRAAPFAARALRKGRQAAPPAASQPARRATSSAGVPSTTPPPPPRSSVALAGHGSSRRSSRASSAAPAPAQGSQST